MSQRAFNPCTPLPRGGLPPLLHQAWISPAPPTRREADRSLTLSASSESAGASREGVPLQFLPMVARWNALLPGWTTKQWNAESSRQLWLEHRPELIDLYDGYGNAVQRADASRYLYLLKYGGIYADLDVAPCNSLLAVLDAMNRTKHK